MKICVINYSIERHIEKWTAVWSAKKGDDEAQAAKYAIHLDRGSKNSMQLITTKVIASLKLQRNFSPMWMCFMVVNIAEFIDKIEQYTKWLPIGKSFPYATHGSLFFLLLLHSIGAVWEN